jgi:hypothetical protein
MPQRQHEVADAIMAQPPPWSQASIQARFQNIKQLQADKAAALDSARSIEAAISDLISYPSCPKSYVNTG